MTNSILSTAVSDVVAALRRISLIQMLGWHDVRQRYKRSVLGPFWLTISMGVMIGAIGIVFGKIFRAPIEEFLPFLSIGLILWSFIQSVLNDGGSGFVASERIIKQTPLPLFVHIARLVWKNIIIFGHNLAIYPLVLIVVAKPLGLISLLSVIGFLIVVLNVTWAALLLGIVCARYRDLPQIVASALQVLFYLTPIVWMPQLLPERSAIFILGFNPVYHLLEIVRGPLLGYMPASISWLLSIGMALLGWSLTLCFYGKYRKRIVYWL